MQNKISQLPASISAIIGIRNIIIGYACGKRAHAGRKRIENPAGRNPPPVFQRALAYSVPDFHNTRQYEKQEQSDVKPGDSQCICINTHIEFLHFHLSALSRNKRLSLFFIQRIFNGLFDHHTGISRARHGIHVRSLFLYNLIRNYFR